MCATICQAGAAGKSVLYDDAARAGEKFAGMELIGLPTPTIGLKVRRIKR